MQMIGNKRRLRVVGPSDDDYDSARRDGLAETERFMLAMQWHEAVKNLPDAELTPQMCGYRDGLREGLGL
jgi:hypothetical protein